MKLAQQCRSFFSIRDMEYLSNLIIHLMILQNQLLPSYCRGSSCDLQNLLVQQIVVVHHVAIGVQMAIEPFVVLHDIPQRFQVFV